MEATKHEVHNHGPAEGRGLDCGERIIDEKRYGWCVILGSQALLSAVRGESNEN